jgi:NOL1/NOP2/fmu family ribosome biogenesis protein
MPRFIFKTEKREIMKKLEYYGIEELPFLLIASGKDKVRGYTGILSTDEIIEFEKAVGIEVAGLYLFHNYPDSLRLSVDAIILLKDKITKNILELNEKQAKEWFSGQDYALSKEEKEELKKKKETTGFKVIKIGKDFVGMGKLTEDRLINYTPKERRIR